ncbi:MAG: acyl-CoA dehydratase activase-related protein, partial [candidate division WOR-3 bacterium]
GCPKAIALPDLTRAVFPSLSQTVELIVDQRIKTEETSFQEVAKMLGINGGLAKRAFKEAQIVSIAAEKKTKEEGSPEHMFKEPGEQPIANRHCESRRDKAISLYLGSGQSQDRERIGERHLAKIGVIGHPYLLFDNCINLGLWKILTELEVLPLVSFPDKTLIEKEAANKRSVNWYYEMEILTSVRNFLQTGEVKGLLLIASFSCGTAAVVNEIIRREIAREAKVPILTILLDEHTAEAGLRTRLESFVDILERKA